MEKIVHLCISGWDAGLEDDEAESHDQEIRWHAIRVSTSSVITSWMS